jgi:hypothetical protein
VVSDININPGSPVFGQIFDCYIAMSDPSDEWHLACGLQRMEQSSTDFPYDICPKKNNLGHQGTSNNTRYFKCVANADTHVPGPGNYKIVAWYFQGDGQSGQVLMSKPVTFGTQPAPTNTPPPPTVTPIIVPSVTPVPSATSVPNIPSPTRQYAIPTNPVAPPTTHIIPSNYVPNNPQTVNPTFYNPNNQIHATPPFTNPNNANYGSALLNIPQIAGWVNTATTNLGVKGKSMIIGGINIFEKVIKNFLTETAF